MTMLEVLFGKPPVNTKNAKLEKISLDKVIDIIKKDKKLILATEQIRNIKTKPEQKLFKSTNLPYIIPFNYKELTRNSKNFQSAEILIFEADDVKDLPQKLKLINKDETTLFTYTSVSGNGFKLGVKSDVKITVEHYLRVYNVLRRQFNTLYDIVLDPSNKDLARVQYLSNDNTAYYNPNSRPIKTSEIIKHLQVIDQLPQERDIKYELNYDKKDIVKAIDYIRKNGYLEMKDEQLWWELSMSIASLGEDGRDYFLRLSLDNPQYPEDTQEKLNLRYDKLLESWGNYHDEDRVLSIDAFFNKIEKVFKYKTERAPILRHKHLELILTEKFVSKYKDYLLYDHSKSGKGRNYGWYIWDGRYFLASKKGEITDCYLEFIQEEKKRILRKREKDIESGEGEQPEEQEDDLQTDEYKKAEALLTLTHISKAETRRLRDVTLTWASENKSFAVLPDELDQDPELLCVLNGIVNIRKNILIEHDAQFKMTKIANVIYQQNAKCHQWEHFINKICYNNIEMAKYIQEAVGYSLTGHTSEQCLFFLYGTGANGKSTFLEGLKLIFGEYQIHSNYETFTSLGRDGSSHSEDVVRLKGSRLVISSEINANKSLNESVIKQITSGDTITARDLHSSSIEFKPNFKLWISGNHKPKINNYDYGIRRRIFIIPFEHVFKDEDIRPQYEVLEEFKSEASGILNWALEGAQRWFKNKKLTVPDIINETTKKYFLENNIIEQFLNDKCIIPKSGQADFYTFFENAKTLYEIYLQYIENTNEDRLGRNSFYTRLEELGFKRDISSKDRQPIFRGLKLGKRNNEDETVKVEVKKSKRSSLPE